ncbi:MAG: transcriptional regulator GcvA [Rhodospirillales bacterium]|nr:transcriptional regulator GcvA [Rhodospirillales bacterium]
MRFLPSINALRAFQASARSLSFTKAALELNVTQGAVSHQVKGLEDRLGVKLFLRVRQRLQLTQQGKGYLPFVRQALDLLEAGNAYLETNEKSGILTVSVSPNFATKWLVPRLGDFIATHPEIELRISASTQHVDLARSDIDMAVRHGQGDWLDLDVQRLCPEQVFPVCSPDFLKRHSPIEQPHDLTALPLLHDRSRQDWPLWFAAAGVTETRPPPGPQFDQTSMVIDAAIEGQGVALARSALAARDLMAGRLIRLFNVSLPAPFAYYIVCPKTAAKMPKISQFRDWLLQEAKGDNEQIGI